MGSWPLFELSIKCWYICYNKYSLLHWWSKSYRESGSEKEKQKESPHTVWWTYPDLIMCGFAYSVFKMSLSENMSPLNVSY